MQLHGAKLASDAPDGERGRPEKQTLPDVLDFNTPDFTKARGIRNGAASAERANSDTTCGMVILNAGFFSNKENMMRRKSGGMYREEGIE